MNFEVESELFKGPIDLLLHLVKSRELPIEKLSLAKVANQYLEYIELMRWLDLDVASEYLVVAATLVSIKSSYILNKTAGEEEPDESGMDPHVELLRRLKEAEVFKEGARQLGMMKILGEDVFAPPSLLKGLPDNDDNGEDEFNFANHDQFLLGKAFRKLLKRSGSFDTPITIELEEISVVERMMEVIEILKSKGGELDFNDLIPEKSSRMSLIVSFVAMLELCKRSVIWVMQKDGEATIIVRLGAADVDGSTFVSEFDRAVSVNE